MDRREALQQAFEEITPNVYYNPPNGCRLIYPCIVYKLTKIRNRHANNKVYNQDNMFRVTVIDTDPDSEISKTISKFPKCAFIEGFYSDNLLHHVYQIY